MSGTDPGIEGALTALRATTAAVSEHLGRAAAAIASAGPTGPDPVDSCHPAHPDDVALIPICETGGPCG